MSNLRIGVIGVGNMGSRHCRVYHEMADVDLVACADTDTGKLGNIEKGYGCNGHSDHRAMLEEEKPLHGVSVAVPTSKHCQVALDVIERGIPVLIEKPIALTMEQALLIKQTAEEKGVPVLVGHTERFNPVVIQTKRIAERGCIGEVVAMHARRVGTHPPQIVDANIIIDSAIHDIDIANQFFGLPIRVCVNAASENCVDMLLSYEGKTCVIQTNWITPTKIRKLSITGLGGYIEADYISQKLEVVIAKGDQRMAVVFKDEPLALELKNFVQMVRGEEEPRITVKEACQAVSVALRVSGMAWPGKGPVGGGIQ